MEISLWGGQAFYSSNSNWNPNNHLIRERKRLSKFYNIPSIKDSERKQFTDQFNSAVSRVGVNYHMPRRSIQYKYMGTDPSAELGTPELFQAQPSDDIPRNKLTERLARGL